VRQVPVNAPPIHPLMHVPVPWVFVLSYLAGVGLQVLMPIRVLAPAVALSMRAGGVVLLAAGAMLATWCLAIFRRQNTTTIPFGTSTRLVTWGPYRFSRNPMYVSLSLIYLGEAGVLIHGWPLLTWSAVIAYLNWIVVPYEERRLREAFGSDYEHYRAQVRRWIGRR
jgi:protein-S-isoprenylcysteine O-methyltransferase Ste14